MQKRRIQKILAGTGLAACLSCSSVWAGVFNDVATGLGFAGFNIEGSRNPLSGGFDFLVNRTFVGDPLDFGAWDLTLQGPLSLSLSTGGRFLSQLDVALRTATDDRANPAPLSYSLNYDVGGQSTQVSGTLFLDGDVSFNGFGFYDLQLTYSSRQDVTRDGRFANDAIEHDLDVGPINISGNIFADALAILTDPIFESSTLGFNPFESFSGRAQLQTMMDEAAARTREQLASGEDFTADALPTLLASAALQGLFDGNTASAGSAGSARSRSPGASALVPEPAVLVLLLFGAPFVLARRPQSRIPKF